MRNNHFVFQIPLRYIRQFSQWFNRRAISLVQLTNVKYSVPSDMSRFNKASITYNARPYRFPMPTSLFLLSSCECKNIVEAFAVYHVSCHRTNAEALQLSVDSYFRMTLSPIRTTLPKSSRSETDGC